MKKPAKKPKARKAAKPKGTPLGRMLSKSLCDGVSMMERGEKLPTKRVAKPGVRMWVTQDTATGSSGGCVIHWSHGVCVVHGDGVAMLRRAGLKRLPKPGECVPIRMVILED